MFNRFISILFLTFIIVTCIIFFFPALFIWLVTAPFDKRKFILHKYTCFWGAFYTWVMPAWRVRVLGRDKYDRKKTYVIISNHQSQLDILVAFNLFFHFKWVSKAEIFRVPFVGWNMVFNKYIHLKRGDKASIEQMMKDAEEALTGGNSVYFFPEGTRSETGIVKPFKPGAFILAKKLGLSILPIVITGTKNALPKHSVNFHGIHKIRLKILDEIPAATVAKMSVEKLIAHSQKIITDGLKTLEGELARGEV